MSVISYFDICFFLIHTLLYLWIHSFITRHFYLVSQITTALFVFFPLVFVPLILSLVIAFVRSLDSSLLSFFYLSYVYSFLLSFFFHIFLLSVALFFRLSFYFPPILHSVLVFFLSLSNTLFLSVIHFFVLSFIFSFFLSLLTFS